jgi:HAD superfamily hydrolase (TIGR01509 family)
MFNDLNNIKAIIFDFDDTLCLTEETCFNLENEVGKSLGFPPVSRELHQQTWGQKLNEVCMIRFPGVTSNSYMLAHAKIMNEWIAEGKMDVITPENLKLLSTLKTNGYKVGILTSRTKQECLHLMDRANPLSELIDFFHYQESCPYTKPDPRVFGDILMAFGVKPEETIYIGDSPTDAKAANGAGINFIASLESGLRTELNFQSYQVKFFIYSLTELADFLQPLA